MATSILGDCPIGPSGHPNQHVHQAHTAGPGRSPHAQPVVGIFVGTGWINILLTYEGFFRKCSDMIAAGPTNEIKHFLNRHFSRWNGSWHASFSGLKNTVTKTSARAAMAALLMTATTLSAIAESPYPTQTPDGRKRIQRTGTRPSGYVGSGNFCEALHKDTPAAMPKIKNPPVRLATSPAAPPARLCTEVADAVQLP